jgi:hypothetical protein
MDQKKEPVVAVCRDSPSLGASEYRALPDLDANATEVAIEKLVLEHEGWERDESVTEPSEPKS